MNSNKLALQNYRQWIRCINSFPITDLQSKLKFNLREIFEIRKNEKDVTIVKEWLDGSKLDIELMKEIVNLPLEMVLQLYQPFSTTLARSSIPKQQELIG